MKKSFWNKRIPTILGLFLITIGIGLTSYFVNQGVFYITRATPVDNPQEVRITNITDSTTTISFSTNGEAIGSINIGENKDSLQKVLDDKDQTSGDITPRKIHSITARNLKPQTKYYFSITSGEETYLNNDSFYEVTTGSLINSKPNEQEPITGKILLSNGEPPKEAIIYATIEEAQVISTIVKEDGSYILPLNSLRNKDLSSYFMFAENTNIKMTIVGDGYSSNILLSLQQINPVPLITLSKNYDFTTSLEAKKASESGKLEKLPSFPASSTSKNGISSPSIASPKEENQSFSDLKPEFKGKAIPNEVVKIIINSENQIEDEVNADKYGNWYYRPKEELSPGDHTITIISKDAQGILRTITKSFTVYASGSTFSDSLSPTPTGLPSITLTPTITPLPTTTVTPTPTTEPEVTVSPTITITPIIALSPTITPIPTQVIIQTPTPTVINATPSAIQAPPSVGSSSLINLFIIGITTTILGIILLLLSRGRLSFL